jgi:hypothetical protein
VYDWKDVDGISIIARMEMWRGFYCDLILGSGSWVGDYLVGWFVREIEIFWGLFIFWNLRFLIFIFSFVDFFFIFRMDYMLSCR